MAGHLALSKIDEPEIFKLVEKIKNRVIVNGYLLPDFSKFIIPHCYKQYNIMKLSNDYVEKPISQIAFMIGKFSLKSITDEHPSITQNINLEVHFNKGTQEIINIFWVA